MSADGNENDMLGGLFKGAAFYLVKPITVHNIKNLWQFAFMKKMDPLLAAEFVSGDSPDEDMEIEQSHRNAKRKEPKEMHNVEEDENGDSSVLKKPKLIWTNDLHNRFLRAVRVLGIDGKVFLNLKLKSISIIFCNSNWPFSFFNPQFRGSSKENTSAYECPRTKERKYFEPSSGV